MSEQENVVSLEQLNSLWKNGTTEQEETGIYKNLAEKLTAPATLDDEMKWEKTTGFIRHNSEGFQQIGTENGPETEDRDAKAKLIGTVIVGMMGTVQRRGENLLENNVWANIDIPVKRLPPGGEPAR